MSGAFCERVARDGLAWEDAWLDPRTCARVVGELDFAFWRRSQVADRAEGVLVSRESIERTSLSTSAKWFSPALRRIVDDIQARLVTEFGVDEAHLEAWQAVAYAAGGRFGTHHDGGHLAGEPGGERVLTFLLCVAAPDAGGATYFPDLDLLLQPVAGRLVVWNNLTADGTIDQRMRHAATPVHEGRKVMLTTWSRQRPLHA